MRNGVRYIAIVSLLALSIGLGCDRWPTLDPIHPAPVAPPVPVNVTAQVNDLSVELSWEISDSASASRFRIYRADSAEGEFYLTDSTSDYVDTLTNLPPGQALRFRVAAVGVTGIEGLPSNQVSAVPGLLTIEIDGGAEYTRDRDVTVRITVPGAAAYAELSEDPSFADATLEPFANTLSFELSPDDGAKTVYARITYTDGTVSERTVSDEIILDTEANIDSVWFTPTGVTSIEDDTVYFFLDAGADLSGDAGISLNGQVTIDLHDDGVAPDTGSDDGVYSAAYEIPGTLYLEDGEVRGSFRDAAGNAAAEVVAEELINVGVNDPPEAVIVAAGLIDPTLVRITWSQSSESDFASYRINRSQTSGLIVDDADSLRVAIITQRTTVSYDDFLPTAGTYYYRVFVFDGAEQSAASNEVTVTR